MTHTEDDEKRHSRSAHVHNQVVSLLQQSGVLANHGGK